MRKHRTRKWTLAVLVVTLTATVLLPQSPVRVQNGVRAKMRDGVSLVADVYRPRAAGSYPVVLERTPYDRKAGTELAQDLAANGYIVVRQDVRGRFDSEGEFYPFLNESHDGYDSVEWAAALDGSNGKVGMMGGSYVGATQMLAAISVPPHLEAIFPYVTASEYYEGWTYQGGAWMQWFSSSWASGLAIDTARRRTANGIRSIDWVKTRAPADYPLLAPAPAASSVAPYYRDWMEHERNDEYWRRWKISDHYGKMKVKALHGGGWHDIFSGGTIRNYMGLLAGAATGEARSGQRLMMGPWAHAATSSQGKVGDVTFGESAVLNMNQTALHWFNYALKGEQNEYATGAPVKIFVMGENRWREEREFPPARAQATRYYLREGKTLNTAAPGIEAPAKFVYDPANPVPTIGGRLCCGGIPPGPADQRANESRPDVLVFSTPPLEAPLEVTGFITLELFAATSAVDTDWTAMLVDVAPDGYARYLADGIVRARYRNSTERAEPLQPGKAVRYAIDLWATSNVFLPGHQLRVYVSSSNFPRFNRNLNTGVPILTARRMVKAEQTIYHDREHPSAIVLPVVR